MAGPWIRVERGLDIAFQDDGKRYEGTLNLGQSELGDIYIHPGVLWR